MEHGDRQGPVVLLVPGAWMGAWIWDDMLASVRRRGHAAMALTLPGLEAARPNEVASRVTLEDHVRAVLHVIESEQLTSIVLVAHSYSGVVVGQVADRLPEVVRRSVHIGSFLPRDGRSLLDDWGPDVATRQAEKDEVASTMLWDPPPAAALEGEADLASTHRRMLGERFVAHPGRTVLDPAVLSRPITRQPVTYIATAATGDDPRADLPPELAAGVPARWEVRAMTGGHWPMLTRVEELSMSLDEALSSA